MSDFGYRCQMLAETSRRPELMDRMMERMLVSLSLASRVEGGSDATREERRAAISAI